VNKDKTLEAYQRAINKIDDYFEYRYKFSEQDDNKLFVISVLDELADELIDLSNK
jgi:hypothetical protein